MVVSSLVITTLRGLAEQGDVGVLELEADLLGDDLAAGEDRDVLQHGLAAVAEARALTATDLKVPRILLTTSVERASPSTSSARISSGLPDCMTFSRTGAGP